jgi:hypothetical protein
MKPIEELKDKLSTPSDRLVKDMQEIDGGIMILGVGGKMGPSLAKLAARTFQKCGSRHKVIGVSRFTKQNLREELQSFGIETIALDLLNEKELQALPEAENIIYMAGKKFGTSGRQSFTWAMNTYLPGRIAEKFKNSRIVAFSTGNVYPFVSIASGGAAEQTPLNPVGEYAQSCVGRERIFEYFSERYGIPMLFFRLNYAVEMRYGTLVDIAKAVYKGEAIDLRNGNMNVIWQGDANEFALRCLLHCSIPPKKLNVTGPEIISIRSVAAKFGEIFDKKPQFTNEERETSPLSNASQAHKLFGYPGVPLGKIIEWTADWIRKGKKTIDKPTHFEVRSGNY